MPPRVAVDANVLIAGNTWPRWPYEVLLHAVKGDYTLVLSPLVIEESRRRRQKYFSDTPDRLEAFLQAVNYESAPLSTAEEIAVQADLVRQPEDIPVALSIIAARVDYFVTYDKDFTDDHESTAKVKAAIPGIMLPPVFLRDVMGWTSEELEQVRGRKWSDLESEE